MSHYSSQFVKTVALIAVRTKDRWGFLSAERCVNFAWFSCNEIGDASVDDGDLVRHFKDWVECEGLAIPEWMI